MQILPEYLQIEKELQTNSLIFVTGPAGTGKSTFIHYIKEKLENAKVLAPTGIAARNVEGTTIHSFFNLPFDKLKPTDIFDPSRHKIYRQKRIFIQEISTIIIDEVSMLLPNILDAIDLLLKDFRKNSLPFGGVKIILVGDLLQLPPIVSNQEEKNFFSTDYKTPYFFSAHSIKNIPQKSFFLKKIMRQQKGEEKFIQILNSIRLKSYDCEENLKELNKIAYEDKKGQKLSKDIPRLFTKNINVDNINNQNLAKIDKEEHIFKAKIEGKIRTETIPAPETLKLKIGAKVLFVKNNFDKNWCNGDFGEVVDLEQDIIFVKKE